MILADLTYAYNPVSGGVRTYIDAKRKFIAENTDWKHLLVVPGEEDSVVREGPLTTAYIKAGPLPISPQYRLILRLGAVVEILRRFAPDVIELGSVYTLPWAAFRYRKERSVAVAGFYHTDLADAYVRPTAERLLGETVGGAAAGLVSRYVRAVYSRCDLTLAASESVVEKVKAMGIPRVEYAPLGVDLDLWRPVERDNGLREELGIPLDVRLLMYVGRLDTEKRVEMLRQAVMMLPDQPTPLLVFIGQGPEERSLKIAASTTDRIRVLSFEGDKSRLARIVASADAYLAGNPNETFGLSIVEAQAAGIPIVGVRSGALIERVPRELGELCEPDNARDMANAIERLFRRSDLQSVRVAARKHVADRFGWNVSIERILHLYVDLLERRNGAA